MSVLGLSTPVAAALGGLMVLVGGGFVIVLMSHFGDRAETVVDGELARAENESADDRPGHALQLDPPDINDSWLGLLAMWLHRRKEQRLARKGYVKWYKIGARRRRPQWVKPETDGAGVPEYYDGEDEQTYLFPANALVTDARTGAYVAEHRVDQAEPINLQEPEYPPLEADRLEEVINLEAESEAPGFFDRLDIDQTTMMWLLIGGAFVVFAAYRYMGGA